jgi:superoxide reductase
MQKTIKPKGSDFRRRSEFPHETHAPVIDCPDCIDSGKPCRVTASVGPGGEHPRGQNHYISWVQLFFQARGEKGIKKIGKYSFNKKGWPERPEIKADIALEKSGTFHAVSYCSIHGLWESRKEVTVQ